MSLLVTGTKQAGQTTGDFVVTQANGERYPILSEVFYGTYQILGRVGPRHIGRRLLHARRAWPILSAHGEFNYGADRGIVAIAKGGWLYRSDENDFGVINRDAKGLAHIEVGTTESLQAKNWKLRFSMAMKIISLLPPIMTLLALLAYSTAIGGRPRLSEALLLAEGVLMSLGAASVWQMKRRRWVLKAAVSSGMGIARDFQVAVSVLGHQPSDTFPDMALWRAAQSEQPSPSYYDPVSLKELKEQVSEAYERVRTEIEHSHSEERRAQFLSWMTATVVFACIIATWRTHTHFVELLAIWLPSVVGAIHASLWRRQVLNRIGAARDFAAELAFVRSQLITHVPANILDQYDSERVDAFCSTVRVLCRAAAEHNQRSLQFAISEEPNVAI